MKVKDAALRVDILKQDGDGKRLSLRKITSSGPGAVRLGEGL